MIKNYTPYYALAVVLLVGGVYWYVHGTVAPAFTSVTVGRGNIVQSVDESGNVLAENSASLSFQEAGQIAHVYVSEGNSVSAGAVLADLDKSQLVAAGAQASAAVSATQARLDELTSGTRPEQIAIDRGSVVNAEASLSAATLNAYTAADDAVRNQIDNLFSNPQTNNPSFLIPSTDSQTQINIQAQRVGMENTLNQWYAVISATSSDLSAITKITDASLRSVVAYLNTVALAVNAVTPNQGIPPATLSAYKANVVTARTEVSAAVNVLTGAESNLTTAQNALMLAQAGATPQEIEAQKAVVLEAQALATNAQVAIDHASLIAPFAGAVQNLTAKVGQVVAPGAQMLSLVNNSGLKIETFVSETDIAKVKEGEKANITLDAYGTGTVFPGVVTAIDSSKTTVNGVPAYKVTLHFTNPDNRLKDGMTANVHIISAEHDNVLEVPTRLIVTDNNSSFVLVQNGSATEKRTIVTGITGNDGTTEVISGLNEGDRIITF